MKYDQLSDEQLSLATGGNNGRGHGGGNPGNHGNGTGGGDGLGWLRHMLREIFRK